MNGLGTFLERCRRASGIWAKAYFVFLGLLCVLNLFERPEDPHFVYDGQPFFWPLFGFLVGLAMVFMVKRLIQPLIVRKEDYYNDL